MNEQMKLPIDGVDDDEYYVLTPWACLMLTLEDYGINVQISAARSDLTLWKILWKIW